MPSRWTIKDWVEENLDNYDVASPEGKREMIADCKEAIPHANPRGIRNRICYSMKARGIESENPGRPRNTNSGTAFRTTKAPEESGEGVITADELLGRLDVVTQIKTYLENVIGKDYKDNESLRKTFGIGERRWRDMRNLPALQEHYFSFADARTGKHLTVWSSRQGIKNARAATSRNRHHS